MRNTIKYIYVAIAVIIAILALIVIVSSSNFFGHEAYVVKTGSMSPKIPAGSLVFDSKEQNYRVGDVITFVDPGITTATTSSDLVTHRIIAVQTIGVITYYRVKGDANNAPDPNLVPLDDVVGKVQSHVPKVGYLAAFMKTLPGIVLFIIIPATIIVYEELGKIKNEIVKMLQEAKVVEKEVNIENKKIVAWFKKVRSVLTKKKHSS